MKFIPNKTLLTSVLTASLVVANITAAKIAMVGGHAVPAGFVGIAVAFLVTDVLSETLGEKDARAAVNAAVGSLVVAWVLVYAAVYLPAAPFYDAAAFNATMLQSSYIVLASIVTLLVSQNLDVSVFHVLKGKSDYKFVRNIGSTSISQLVDTSLFIVLGFVAFPFALGGNVTPLAVAAELIVAQYVVKVGVALLDTPLFYLLTR